MTPPRGGLPSVPPQSRASVPTARAAVVLPADPGSPARARQVLRRVLAEADRLDCLDAAELACTELVTNAVLHAHTPIEVTVEVTDAVRVGVHDDNGTLPQRRHYDPHATTGRGLALVAAIADAYGVTDVDLQGKTVWFTVGGGARERSEEDVLRAWAAAAWDVDDDVVGPSAPPRVATHVPPTAGGPAQPGGPRDGAGTRPSGEDGDTGESGTTRATRATSQPAALAPGAGSDGTPASPPVVPVRLEDLPVTLWLAARQHHDGLLRELVLYSARHPEVPLDLVGADRAWTVLSAAVVRADDAHRAGGGTSAPAPAASDQTAVDPAWAPLRLDVVVDVPADVVGDVRALRDALDTGESLARAGEMLARPALPEVVAMRDWACGQVAAQAAGDAPTRWPGVDLPGNHRDDDTASRPDPGFGRPGVDHVRGSDRPVAAADETNRVVAVSDSLARLLGWTVEELVGRRVVGLLPTDLREGHVAGFTRHQTTGESRILGVPLSVPVLRADGTELLCRVVIENVQHDDVGSVYLAWVDPVTDPA